MNLRDTVLVDRHEAEEVAQEVFVKLVRERKKQTPIQSWEAWLTRVTVNACHDHRRSAWWKWWHGAASTLPDDEFPSGGLTPEEQLAKAAQRSERMQALHQEMKGLFNEKVPAPGAEESEDDVLFFEHP